ncbi:5-oxoprolinase [Papilio xuthus]|uniref:5-oxoprolinase n=1 Tax=Papilio xuthus TaxID=66420 RepID=A0A0N1IEG7_PAPXU|nr:5-oxoprolinase [Papilio xuthus]
MDNGTPIQLTVTLDKDKGSAVCDFTGTGVEVWGNLNAPRAITLSALIYCLRCMVGHDVPLNQGCLKPVQVIIPSGSILDPSEGAAVVGGNVLTSQRIVDVVLKAFQVCAASQGCMNNLTLGEANWGYYETVAGGSGAGIQLVSELIDQYGLDVVQAYMAHIQKNAELAVRDMLKDIAKNAIKKTGSAVLHATEYMDNGTPIQLTVTLDKDKGSAVCDFTGTGVEVWGNLNAPRAITLSALIYCLRCMVGHDVPLNQVRNNYLNK